MGGLIGQFSALAVVAWLAGLFYLWAKDGLRGRKDWQLVLESLVLGIFVTSFVWFAFTLFFAGRLQVTGSEIIVSLSRLVSEGYEKTRGKEGTSAAVFFLSVNYLAALAFGRIFGKIAKTKKPFSALTRSALDIEMLELRKKKYVPGITVRFKDGREISGKCLRYSFTEPREVILETGNAEDKQQNVWIRIDGSVSEVIISMEKLPSQKKVILFRGQGEA